MKLALQILAAWVGFNLFFALWRTYVGIKREQFLRWHETECNANRERMDLPPLSR